MGLVSFGWIGLLTLFLCHCTIAISNVGVPLCHRCAWLCCFHVKTLWYTEWGSAERLLWSVGTTSCNIFWPDSNSEVWPAQTIKGMSTVILALFFHYGSVAAGVLISHVGLLWKWMSTDLAEMGAPGVPMSWLLRVSIGRKSLWFSVF